MTWTRPEPWVEADLWWGPAPTPVWRTLQIPVDDRTQHEDAA